MNDFNYTQGGASKIAIETANLLAKKSGYNVYFFSGKSDHNELEEQVIVKEVDVQEALKNPNRFKGIVDGLYNITAADDLKKILLQLDRNETIVHFHGWTKVLSSSVFRICAKLEFKTVLTVHDYFTVCPNGGFYNFKQHKKCCKKPMTVGCVRENCDSRNYLFKLYRCLRMLVQKRNMGLIDKYICISEFSKDIILNQNSAMKNADLIYNPVAIHTCNDDFVKESGYYLFVGRVCYEKGVDLFCEAISKLGLDGVVVGDGPLLEELKSKYKKIQFTGWKSEKYVNEYITKSKAVIFPSDWYETMGLTVVEAQILNKPVFVKDGTAAVEFTDNKELIFTSIEDLERKLLLFESDYKKYTGKTFSKENLFSGDNYVKQLIECYESIIS